MKFEEDDDVSPTAEQSCEETMQEQPDDDHHQMGPQSVSSNTEPAYQENCNNLDLSHNGKHCIFHKLAWYIIYYHFIFYFGIKYVDLLDKY